MGRVLNMSREPGGTKSFRRAWAFLSVVTLNSLVLFAALNLVSWLALLGIARLKGFVTTNPVRERYGNLSLEPVYPGLASREIDLLLAETWSRSHAYEPFTQHKERAFRGSYVNINTNGFRESGEEKRWPPSDDLTNVFFFGGSTSFGMGLPDNQTIAAHLAQLLTESIGRRVEVYNFGRGYYYSSQERALFAKLLSEGHLPDIAIFLDGLNEFILDQPAYTERLAMVMDGQTNISGALDRLPLVKAARIILKGRLKVNHESKLGDAPALMAENTREEDRRVRDVLERYAKNKRMISALATEFNVRTLFVWQPVPTYKYDLDYHMFASNSPWMRGAGPRTAAGYELFAQRLDQQISTSNILWLADIQETLAEPVYVDQVHYTSAMSWRIAHEIGEAVRQRELIIAD